RTGTYKCCEGQEAREQRAVQGRDCFDNCSCVVLGCMLLAQLYHLRPCRRTFPRLPCRDAQMQRLQDAMELPLWVAYNPSAFPPPMDGQVPRGHGCPGAVSIPGGQIPENGLADRSPKKRSTGPLHSLLPLRKINTAILGETFVFFISPGPVFRDRSFAK
ncbi:MAG: hypothetical protein ABFS39_18400, partial [Pseudomonadota bacterium]